MSQKSSQQLSHSPNQQSTHISNQQQTQQQRRIAVNYIIYHINLRIQLFNDNLRITNENDEFYIDKLITLGERCLNISMKENITNRDWEYISVIAKGNITKLEDELFN